MERFRLPFSHVRTEEPNATASVHAAQIHVYFEGQYSITDLPTVRQTRGQRELAPFRCFKILVMFN